MFAIIYNIKIIAISFYMNPNLFYIFMEYKKTKNSYFLIPLVKLVLILTVVNFYTYNYIRYFRKF